MPVWALRATPRDWQRAALERWSENFRGVTSVITGAGKTFFAFLCMIRFVERYPHGRVVIVVPTSALLDQWFLALTDDLGVAEGEVALYSGLHRKVKPNRINLLVLNTARTAGATLTDGADCLLIVDECHRAGSPINANALRGDYRGALGLSATPVREYDDGFDEIVTPVLGPVIYEYDYTSARRDGIVISFNLTNVRVPLLPHEQKRYAVLTRNLARLFNQRKQGIDVEEKIKHALLRRAALAASAAMRIPAAAKLAEKYRGTRMVVFHERIPEATKLARVLSDRGLRVALYHSKLAEAVRRDNLRLFRKGVFDCLVTCRALDEGIDVPEASVAIVASSTRSRRQRIQRLGRVLRPAKGKSQAQIFTLYATLPEERTLLREAEGLEGVASVKWLSIAK
jgi:superfamily II DNA or RNA helicase